MSLTNILILVGISFGIFILSNFNRTRVLRKPLLLILNTGVIFWLQPALPIRGLDFWLPVATLALVALGWVLTSKPEERSLRTSLITGAMLVGTVLVIALTRIWGMSGIITPSRPPQTLSVVLILVFIVFLFLGVYWVLQMGGSVPLAESARGRTDRGTVPYVVGILLLLMIFAALKLPILAEWLSGVLRNWNG